MNLINKTILIILLCGFTINSYAQVPNTDIWLLDIVNSGDSVLLKNPVNITNRTGYDNQPAFSRDGTYLLYTSIRDEKQSDIYKYDLTTKATTQFCNTPKTSEYSPTFMPDGKNISVVMVEQDSAQRLWKFPIKGGTPSLIMSKIDSIGYHCWLDKDNIALFLITNPFQLVFANIQDQKRTIIVHDTIARGMNLLKGKGKKDFYYSSKGMINSVNMMDNNKIKTVAEKKFASEDFTFLNPLTIIMADEASIYKNYYWLSKKDGGNDWTEIVNLSKLKIKKITRIAVGPNGNKIAIVAEY